MTSLPHQVHKFQDGPVYADTQPHTDWCAFEAEQPDAASLIDNAFTDDGDNSSLMDAMCAVADALQRTRMRQAVEDDNFKHAWDVAASWRCKIDRHRRKGMANPPTVLPPAVVRSNALGLDAARQERLAHFAAGYGGEDAEGPGGCDDGTKQWDEQWSGAEF